MVFREALVTDISQIQIVRNSVKEKVLSNPALVTDAACEEFITVRGKGWVCIINDSVVGFSIADIKQHNIWALFVMPEYEKLGIGKRLHNLMMNWYFSQTKETVWLSTAPFSKAESFYKKAGWKEVGIYGKGEIKFEMSYDNWRNNTFIL